MKDIILLKLAIESCQNGGQTALLYAVKNGTFDIVKFICDNSKRLLDERDYGGVTPLIAACEEGFEEIVSFLIEKGADPNINRVEDGFRALEVAIGRGDVFDSDKLSKLVKAGADFKEGSAWSKFTPLQVAIKSNNIDALNFLLSKLCPDNSKLDNENAISSIKTAIDYDNLKATKLLMPKFNVQQFNVKQVHQIHREIEKRNINPEIKSLIENYINPQTPSTGKRKREDTVKSGQGDRENRPSSSIGLSQKPFAPQEPLTPEQRVAIKSLTSEPPKSRGT